jgi:hypothetical protein
MGRAPACYCPLVSASLSLDRLARNQVLFREVNERVNEVAPDEDGGRTEYMCECSREDCLETIPLDPAEYEGVRSSPNLFVIAPGHELLEIDRVVEEQDRFTLVEKTNGEDLAIKTDPRSPRE